MFLQLRQSYGNQGSPNKSPLLFICCRCNSLKPGCDFQSHIAPPGFEPGSQPPEGRILDRCTTGLVWETTFPLTSHPFLELLLKAEMGNYVSPDKSPLP